ncbi:MAG: EAL domain-containing protein [Actinobacteria bacterium]|nr:EAL domain-containing protein [Actinomycetota bacterium]
MRKRAWLAYPILATVATVVYYATGHVSVLFNVIGFSSPVAIVIAVRMHKPEQRAPWYLFALGQTLFITGDVLAYNYERFFGQVLPYPSIADVAYLSVYPCLALGLLLLVRRRSPGRDWASFIDSLMVAIGVGTLSWVFLISPYWHDEQSGLLTKLTSMAYPIMDVILISVAIRLAVGAGRKAPSFLLMLGAAAVLFVTDALYGWSLLHKPYQPGSGLLEIGWIAFYVGIGMAALHPSMPTLAERAPERMDRFSLPRLALLSGAALIPPVLRLVQTARHEQIDSGVLSSVSIALFLLVVSRMAGLIRQQERSTLRERALRVAGAELVTATSREGIYASAIDAVRTLAGDVAIRVCAVLDDPGTFTIAAAAGSDEDVLGRTFPVSTLAQPKLDRLLGRRSYQVLGVDSSLREPLGLPQESAFIHVSPLFIRDELRGLMVAAGATPLPRPIVDGLEALSSQLSLALESAVLTEELLIQQSEARFSSLVKNASDVVAVIDPDTVIRYASPSSSRVLGYEPGQLEGTKFADLVYADDKTRALSFLTAIGESEGHTGLLEFRVNHHDGTTIHAETLRTDLRHDPNVKGIVLNVRDVSERKTFEEQLEHQAFHDTVTGLANRALFRDRVTHALERQQRDPRPVSVLFMDLDDFKTINDSLGHATGDRVLREVGERLRECLRAADTAARMGGDEFAVLLEDGGDGVQAADVADRIMRSLEEPFLLEAKEVFVRASVGIAITEGIAPAGTEAAEGAEDFGGTEGAEELMRNADVAMYMAKENGKGRYQVFEAAMHDTALKRLELKADLQRALEHGEFRLHYQPVIELGTGRISGVEALIRWIHPARGLIPPLDFIPLAEETGLIVAIGHWVLREACTNAVALQKNFPSDPPCHMAVNLSARQLQRVEIVDEVAGILNETGLAPSSLTLEITESVMMQDMDLSIERLTALKSLGVQLAIDDFGTGYSSLNYVRRFPVDILKVDKSFIDGVSDGGESSALTAAVIELAGILNLKPVAEGIERADQLERLLELHCDFGQGFFFAKPLPSDELTVLLTERRQMESEAEALANG